MKGRRLLGGGGFLVAAVLVAVLLLAGLGTLSLSGRLAALQYTNIPILHPYPPPGYYVNPFTGDPRDLVDAADAEKVRTDLLRNGELQLQALARGNTDLLEQTATGRFLAKLRESVASNNARGVVEEEEHHLDSVIVGRLADPNDPSITWCVEERGSGVTTYVDKASGRPVSRHAFRSWSRFWLVRVENRYLVADAVISADSIS